MKVILLKQRAQNLEVMDIDDDLATLKSLIGCHSIDITARMIGGKYYEIVCDDEGLLRKSTITALDLDNMSILAGNLIITGEVDMDGALTSLTDEDIERISENTINVPVGDSSVMILSMSY